MFTEIFGDTPRVKLLDFFADHIDFDYTISQMAEFAEIARPTVYKLVDELLDQSMLTFTRAVGASKFYRLNVENPRIISMLRVDFQQINKEVAAGKYDEKPKRTGAPASPSGRRSMHVRASTRRVAEAKKRDSA